MKVQVFSGKLTTALLHDTQKAKCYLEDDLLTTHQAALFRLSKGYQLSLHYNAPAHVSLSHAIYKSSFGILRMGNA